MRYFAHIGFNGYHYRGWQKQSKVNTVQEVVQKTFSDALKQPTNCHGCGRTDAMVHAVQYFFHFDYDKPLNPKFIFRINKSLPDDIAVFNIIPMEGRPNAQTSAISRTYNYFIHTSKNPFLLGLSSLYEEKNLNLELMKQAMLCIPNYTDFSLFCKTPLKNDYNICKVSSVELFASPNAERIRFQITANRFVKGMIRIIVKRLLEVGLGELSVGDFEGILSGKIKPSEVTIAYPQGLYLTKVTYPFLDIPQHPEFASVFEVKGNSGWTKV
ncbi:MAG TPA: tRNA pseudouridine synthase A [Tenuifilaceae bacterium]|nr:tRNA pseudouridine synthase A [Tenuifilaceae bacterium]